MVHVGVTPVRRAGRNGKTVALMVVDLGHTSNALDVIWLAAKQCKSELPASDLPVQATPYEERVEFVRRVVYKYGHMSVAEHASITFGISGISRACSHQLVRHRVGCSFSQQSQRCVKASTTADFIVPPSMKDDEFLTRRYVAALSQSIQNYTLLVADGVSKEDARFVLPQATETAIVVTMTARALIHFLHERLNPQAQWEIRALAHRMCEVACDAFLPDLFSGCITCKGGDDPVCGGERNMTICPYWYPARS